MLQIFGVILRENNDEFSEKGGVTPIQKKSNKDFINTGRGGHRFMKLFHKIPFF